MMSGLYHEFQIGITVFWSMKKCLIEQILPIQEILGCFKQSKKLDRGWKKTDPNNKAA